MNKKYIAPALEIEEIKLQKMIATSIGAGEGEGDHDSNSKAFNFDFEDDVEEEY